jgi:tetratricopeptide (TPR) repeat protein/transcriptional regulator with XRE-family HTH domain
MTPTSTFGQSLKRLRRRAGLTQEALAGRAGFSTTYVGMLERGERLPLQSTIEVLARALMTTADEAAALAAIRHDGAPYPDRQDAPNHVPALIGRLVEQERLERHLAGEGPPVLLQAGEPGMGKTRLLEEAAAHGTRRGWTVLQAGCRRHGGDESYSPILQALERFLGGQRRSATRRALRGCAWLSRLLPELAELVGEPLPSAVLPRDLERRLVFAAAARFLGRIGGRRGTLLVLDDLQWAGADAVDLLMFLARQGNEQPSQVRVLGAYRHTELGANPALSRAIEDLAQAGLLTQYMLAPLDAEDARRLLQGWLPDPATLSLERQEQILRQTAGVPFFIRSYAQAVRTGAVNAAGQDLPETVIQSIRQRIAALPDRAREVVQAAAVVGREVPWALLAAIPLRSDHRLLEGLEAACEAGLLEERDGGYRFVHDIIQEVVEADLGAARRMLLHQRIAEAMQAEGKAGDSEDLAYHFERAGLIERALPYLEQAGDRARERLAHITAAEHYRSMIRHLEELERTEDTAQVREKLGGVLNNAGLYTAAIESLERAAAAYRAGNDQERFAGVVAQIGLAHMRRGTADEGIARLRLALPVVQATDQSRGRAALYTALAHLLFVSGRYAEQVETATMAEAAARAIGDRQTLARAQGRHGAALLLLGRLDEAIPVLEQAIADAEDGGDLDTLCRALTNRGVIHFIRGEFELARPFRERAQEAARLQDDPLSIARTLANRGEGALYTGDWASARADFMAALTEMERIEDTGASAYPLLDLALLSLMEGRPDEMDHWVGRAMQPAERGGDLQALRWAATLRAEREIMAGYPERAVARLIPLRDRPGLQETDVTYLLPSLAWAQLESGAVAEARESSRQAVERARAQGNQVILVEALRIRAMVDCREGRTEDALTDLEEGLTRARAMPYPYAEARLLHVLGATYAGRRTEPAGALNDAREVLAAALVIHERLGARADAAAIRQDLPALPYTHLLIQAGIFLTAGQWARLEKVLPPRRARGRPRADDRRTLSAIVYVQHTGGSWGELPIEFGDGATAHRRLQQWIGAGTWSRIADLLLSEKAAHLLSSGSIAR